MSDSTNKNPLLFLVGEGADLLFSIYGFSLRIADKIDYTLLQTKRGKRVFGTVDIAMHVLNGRVACVPPMGL